MVTTVGTEGNFLNMLGDLLSLDRSAISAYNSAIGRIEKLEFKQRLQEFRNDHDRHIRELEGLISELGGTPPTGAGIKSMLTQGKVAIGSLFGDKAILGAMKTNEDDTNDAYERAVDREDVPASAVPVLERGLADERRHRQWIEETIRQL